ncbi:hypothetical protein [Nonomuraea soli]|uniref:Uncharacterized protein n=1 Tax=Nonomuraea soli TaxID=1032476 RepID=A0A7W0HVP4_9ACTN|nr:hypothetical protein [Nonomuraea soli]MBA2897385.1 hypothetical protein [Nonomuraea soli]
MRVRLTPAAIGDLIGATGLVCLVIAAGALLGSWWWSLAALGLVLVGISYSVHTRVTAGGSAAGDIDAVLRAVS